MSSIIQIKRRLDPASGATGAPGGNGVEGELAINAAGTGTPELYFFGGDPAAPAPANRGWMRVNPAPTISVVSKTIAGTGTPAADGNSAAAAAGAWPWVVNAGEVPIVTHDGIAYAFTGGAGTWGSTSGGTALTAGMFTSLGAAPADPQVVDLTAQNAAADPGAAWTAAAATATSSVVFAAWRSGTYLLTNTAAPGTGANWRLIAENSRPQVVDLSAQAASANVGAAWGAAANNVQSAVVIAQFKGTNYLLTSPLSPNLEASWTPLSQDVDAEVVDWSALAGSPADFAAAYPAWGNTFDAAVSIVQWSDSRYYLLVDKANPGANGSYVAISPAVPAALTYRGNVDVEAAYSGAVTASWGVGDFGVVASSTPADPAGTSVTPGAGWPFVGATGNLEVGDLILWDGTNLHVTPMETSLSAYLPLAGGKMADGATVTFDTTTAAGGAGAATQTVIDGAGGLVDNVVVDAGSY